MFHEMLFLLVLLPANAACERQVRCHQIKVITVKRTTLTIAFYKIIVDLLEFVVIKILFKTISGKFFSKLLFPVKYDVINSCKIFYIRYKMRGIKHPWEHEQEFKVLENPRCTTCIQIPVKMSLIFFGRGCTNPPSPSGGFSK